MSHYWVELALWVLAAYAIGCLLSGFFRRAPAVQQPVAVPAAAATMPLAEPLPVEMPEPGVAETVAAPVLRMERPQGIDAARQGAPDNLQQISGIGPKNEGILHTLGFFHFDQIAAWTPGQVAWVDDHLRFNGRIGRERWAEQAKLLAEGRLEEFHALYGSGGLKTPGGGTEAGTKTRRS